MEPTPLPTEQPTIEPTMGSTTSTTMSPSMHPTDAPTASTTMSPSMGPTMEPSPSPTVEPTMEPTLFPTEQPTIEPSMQSTTSATMSPSMHPTDAPTLKPTRSPTMEPTASPSASPTLEPSTTAMPTMVPSSSPTKQPTMDPTLSPTVQPSGSQTESVIRIDDFSSKAAMISDGWVFVNEHPGLDFIAQRPSHFCSGVPDESFCGFAFPAELALQYTFSTTGKAVLEWGQSWAGGSVNVYKNGIEIDSRFPVGAQTTEFDVSAGDMLEIRELGISVINIHSLTITSVGNGAAPVTDGNGNDGNSDDSSNSGSSPIDVIEVNDFSSRSAMVSSGWTFINPHPIVDFIADRPSHFCQGIPDASFCGFAFPQELALQYTFSSNGRAVLEWGQSWSGGSVVVIKNGVEIDERNTIGSQTTEFDVTPGDVVEIRERDTSVINIHGLTISPGSGRRELTARLLH